MKTKFKYIFMIFIIFCSLFNTSYAYNQKYEAIITPKDNGYSATIRQYSKATSRDIEIYNSKTKDYDGWINFESDGTSSAIFEGNNIYTFQFLFHKNILSRYGEGFSDLNDGSVINVYYDENDISSGTFLGHATNIDISDTSIISDEDSLIQEIDGNDIYIKRYKITTIGGEENVLVVDYVLNNSVLERLFSNSNYFVNGDTTTGSIDIRISNVLKFGIKSYLDTLAKFLKFTGNNISAKYRGFNNDGNVEYNEKSLEFSPISSLANLYDNIISIPTGNYYGREVYVRHFNNLTGELITGIESNEQVLLSKDGTKNIVKKGTSDVEDFPYSEYYKYNNKYQMEISKSLVVNADGKRYTYVGTNVTNVNTLDETRSIANIKKSNYSNTYDVRYMDLEDDLDTTTVITRESDYDDITIVDFYYNVTDMPDIDVKVSSSTNLWSNTDIIPECSTTYIPSSEYLKPYLSAPKYILKDLKYKKIIRDNEIYYQVDTFNVYKLSGGAIKNSDGYESDGKRIEGNIIGYGNTSLINDYSGEVLINFTGDGSITSDLEEKVSGEYIGSMPTGADIETILGNNSISNEFDTFLQIPYDKINGLRYVKADAKYVTYNVLDKTQTDGFSIDSNNRHFVNVYTPVFLDTPTVTSDTTDHTDGESDNAVINPGSIFTINIPCASPNFTYYQGISSTSSYTSRYFVMFDFDIIHNGIPIPKGELVEVTNRTGNGAIFTAQVSESAGLVGDDIKATSKIVVFAVASNLPSDQILNDISYIERKIEIEKDPAVSVSDRRYINDTGSNIISFKSICENLNEVTTNHPEDIVGKAMYSDAFYVAKSVVTLRSASRIYDFKITDCSDVNFKNVFRQKNSTNINDRTDINYYAGIRRLFIYSSSYQKLLDRDNININGTKTKTILPLGPYKHTTATYINAPKLGYRISFDLKTAGYYTYTGESSTGKSIQITPSYYYISKDGTSLIQDIDLYYKDESGKYKNFKNSNYTIYFRPKDTYRYTEFNTDKLSDKLEPLNIASEDGYFTLNEKMMSVNDTLYSQAWYGEFKLPNSTIAVKSGDSIRNNLSNGYIGVKFNIRCIDFDDSGMVSVSYSQNDKSANNKDNTSQWDYEGFLGFSALGQKVSDVNTLRLQLEEGIWKIDNDDIYNFVKGTVVLFDLDNRAATDFE